MDPIQTLQRQQKIFDLMASGHTAFYGLNAVGINLHGAKIPSYSDFRQATFDFADLSGVEMCDVVLEGAKIRRAQLVDADLTGAQLQGAQLQAVDATNADFTRANLRGANLNGANLAGAVVDQADLRGASLVGVNFHEVDFRNVGIDRTTIFIDRKWLRAIDKVMTAERDAAIEQEQAKILRAYPEAGDCVDVARLAALHVGEYPTHQEDVIRAWAQTIPPKEKDAFIQQWGGACNVDEILDQIEPVQALIIKEIVPPENLKQRKKIKYRHYQQKTDADPDFVALEEMLLPEQKQEIVRAIAENISLDQLVEILSSAQEIEESQSYDRVLADFSEMLARHPDVPVIIETPSISEIEKMVEDLTKSEDQECTTKTIDTGHKKSPAEIVYAAICDEWPSISLKGGSKEQKEAIWIESVLQGINIDYADSDYRPDDTALSKLGARARMVGVPVSYNMDDGRIDVAALFGAQPFDKRQAYNMSVQSPPQPPTMKTGV